MSSAGIALVCAFQTVSPPGALKSEIQQGYRGPPALHRAVRPPQTPKFMGYFYGLTYHLITAVEKTDNEKKD